ncbi:Pre-rRNA-processing protein fhl1, partial [Rhizopus azygosporus]
SGHNNNEQAYAKLEGDNFCYYIRNFQVTLGRTTKVPDRVDIPLGNAKSVSRQHAQLFYNFTKQQFEMTVFGKNGVFVDERFIEKGITVPLEHRTKIQIGEVSFQFLLPEVDSIKKRSLEIESKCIATAPQQLEKPSIYHVSNQKDANTKPPLSYVALITQAIHSTEDKKMTLEGIYNYAITTYPYYRQTQKEWQSSIRHQLSSNKMFVKLPKKTTEPGKGVYWTTVDLLTDKENREVTENVVSRKRIKLEVSNSNNNNSNDDNKISSIDINNNNNKNDNKESESNGNNQKIESKSAEDVSLVGLDATPETVDKVQAELQNTIRQHILDPEHHPLPPALARLLPQAIAQLPPHLANQLSSTLISCTLKLQSSSSSSS